MDIKKFDKEKFNFKKLFGQNFIFDKNFLEKITSVSNIKNSDNILEIGTGAGTLTEIISERAKKILSYEIDKDLIPYLLEKFLYYENVEIINKDIMKVDNKEINEKFNNEEFRIIANLPYYITTPIIMKFIENAYRPKDIIVMVQKEVADRLTAKANTKNYGAITASLWLYSEVDILLQAPRTLFTPQPDVDSAVIRIKLRDNIDDEILCKNAQKLIHSAFLRRRKTLINNLMQDLNLEREYLEKILNNLGIDTKVRGEVLSPHDYKKLAMEIYGQI